MPSDATINSTSKHRYYEKLAGLDSSFGLFLHPNDSPEFGNCCESAVAYLKTRTREDHLVQEENINYGFCRNLLRSKYIGILICISMCCLIAVYSLLAYETISEIPTGHYFAFSTNLVMILFWCVGVTRRALDNTAITYAKTLLAAIDGLKV